MQKPFIMIISSSLARKRWTLNVKQQIHQILAMDLRLSEGVEKWDGMSYK
ncbi:hypothetical protein ACFLRT_00175 [Acidobacteriota bacterium]